jgi:uncharacterized membrane protein
MNNSSENKIKRRQIIQSFEAKFLEKRTISEKFADYFVRIFGSIKFLVFHLIWFLIWIVWNLGMIPGLPVFDSYPFILLTTIVSIEAIFLSVMVLISQNRAANIDRLRSEVDLQINLIAEQEITKVLNLLTLLMERQGINVGSDPEIQIMLKKIDLNSIEKKIEEQLR